VNNGQMNLNTAGGGAMNTQGEGGALYVGQPATAVTLTGATINDNTAGGGGGTGSGKGGGIASLSSLDLDGVSMAGNTAGGGAMDAQGNGGAVHVDPFPSSTLDITASTLTGNHASSGVGFGTGGGVDFRADGNMTISGSSFTGNDASDYGGAIERTPNYTASPMDSITTSTLTGNTAGPSTNGRGGAIEVESNGQFTVSRSELVNNTATGAGGAQGKGGAIALSSQPDTPMMTLGAGNFAVISSTVDSNTANGVAGGVGGGIASGVLVPARSPQVALGSTTLTDNTADTTGGAGQGGNLVTDGTASTFHIGGSIIAFGHGAVGFEDCRDNGTTVIDSRGSNVVGPAPANQCFLDNTNDHPSTNPMIGPLMLNAPGTTRTRALLPGSPAIDIVPVATLCLGNPPDQRGIIRPQGSACDAGAYEVEVPAPPVTPTPTATATATPATTAKKKCKKKKKRHALASKKKRCKKKKR
jgi:hypothetical protein